MEVYGTPSPFVACRHPRRGVVIGGLGNSVFSSCGFALLNTRGESQPTSGAALSIQGVSVGSLGGAARPGGVMYFLRTSMVGGGAALIWGAAWTP